MRKITLSLLCILGSFALMQAQNSLTSSVAPTESATTVESLLDRLNDIGTVSGNVSDYFTSQEQRMLNVHFNGIQSLAPRVLTLSHSQTIEPGAGIACATHPISYRNNKMYQVYDMVGEFGINNGFEVNAIEFAIDAISTPSGFPIYINIYSTTTPNTFPGGTWNFIATETYDASNADALTIVNVPISAAIPAGEAMIMELILVDDGTDTNYMTFGVNGVGEDGPSWIEAEDCGASVPTRFSALGLSVGMVWNVLGDDEGGSTGGPSTVFAINNTTENLIHFDLDDPAGFSVVGPSAATDFENAGAVDPNDNETAYALDNSGSFFKIDLNTGVYTKLGSIAGPGSETWAGAEFDPVSGNLYAISTNITQSTLSLIDIDNVSRTSVGVTGVEGAISLMIDGNGQAYTHDIVSDFFYEIDLTSGDATAVGSLGFDANFGQGGCWVSDDPGFVYLSAFDNGSFQSQWRRLDVATGASTVVGLFNGGSDQVGWSSPQSEMLKVVENSLEGFTFFPNPTTEMLSLQSINSINSVALYNILGQRVLAAQVDATSKDLDLSGLAAGLYVMKVSVEGQIGTYKIMKN
ncbi:MAG TPA: T9SS type A sorting domain-containing protein [Aequorivita sp.]|nr:T9SS type A sorting domain-containing protein [Aequorivita sp.]